ncbi:uncharacterized protein LOC120639661 [Panicum virgatum]|uniref:Ubiquitin-like protease family profile domain-containing protein n=1 Tax=Panicum virgatum TaxID=38727 RepID=A0A8T0Q6D2_PANVG|nr:uncharacterized protein LOC120639661 [Panicum virgatum]KAG2570451.1 hypothetical protein PVAP13_7KG048709 [Panicum virgatum]
MPYTNIPQQNDSKSCGVYVIKYMLEWNGIQMRNNFTQDQMDIFRRKICCRLLRSENNKCRKASYKEPLTKELYLAANPKVSGSDGEVCIIGTRTGNINHKTGKKSDNKTNNPNDQAKPSKAQKKWGRPRKDGHNTKAITKNGTNKSEMSTVARDPGANKRISNPSQYRKSPYSKS